MDYEACPTLILPTFQTLSVLVLILAWSIDTQEKHSNSAIGTIILDFSLYRIVGCPSSTFMFSLFGPFIDPGLKMTLLFVPWESEDSMDIHLDDTKHHPNWAQWCCFRSEQVSLGIVSNLLRCQNPPCKVIKEKMSRYMYHILARGVLG